MSTELAPPRGAATATTDEGLEVESVERHRVDGFAASPPRRSSLDPAELYHLYIFACTLLYHRP